MPPNGNIEATIDGDIAGQVAVGNYILQIGDVNGGVVNVAPQTQIPNYTRRTGVVNLRPRPFSALLDREDETASLKSALGTSTPVSLNGPDGIGKTSLLRSLAHLPETDQFPDGVVYLSVPDLGLGDVLQSLFDVFHESQLNFKPTDAEIRIAMQGINALIFLDDLELSRDETSTLLDALPGCAFVLAAADRSIWGEGLAISLAGLPVDDAMDLFVLELNRALDEREQAEVREICVLLGSHPLKVLQSASVVREGMATISDVRTQLHQQPDEGALNISLGSSTDTQKRLVAILAAAAGVAVPVEHLRSISQSDVVVKDLQELVSLGLVQAKGSRFQLAGEVSGTISRLWDLTSWEDRLIEFLIEWLVKKPAQNLLDESLDMLVHSVRKAEEKNRWLDVIKLGRGFERLLVLRKRWQTWLDILNLILKAARALGDRKVEGWALHQIGTRAACLGFNESAREFLTQALNIRQAIGDKAGLAVTQNNLHVFFKIPLPPQAGRTGCRNCLTCGAVGAGVAAIATVVIAGAYLFLNLTPDPVSPPTTVPEVFASETPIPPTHTRTPTHTSTPIPPSHTPTLTRTNTPTRTPTLTRTPTRTPTPTNTLNSPPPAPGIVYPKDTSELVCTVDEFYLDWTEPVDESGIDIYQISIGEWHGLNLPCGYQYCSVFYPNPDPTTSADIFFNLDSFTECNRTYRWRVRARDNAGAWGEWSPWTRFTTVFPGPD